MYSDRDASKYNKHGFGKQETGKYRLITGAFHVSDFYSHWDNLDSCDPKWYLSRILILGIAKFY